MSSPNSYPPGTGTPSGSRWPSPMTDSPAFSSTAAHPSFHLATSPYSPFPFGSPITHSRRSVLNPGTNSNAAQANASNAEPRRPSPIQTRIRLRARDLYGGPIMFGGPSSLISGSTSTSLSLASNAAATMASSLRKSNRLLSSAPYHASMRLPNRSQRPAATASMQPQPTVNDHEDESALDTSAMSSTAKIILETLEKMSTPIKDAQKIPIASARAEKRKAIADQLLERKAVAGSAGSSPASAGSGSSNSYTNRRRPRLDGRTSASGGGGMLLNGPPLRNNFSPVISVMSPSKKRGRIGGANESPGTSTASSSRISSGAIGGLFSAHAQSSTSSAVIGESNSLKFSVPALQKAKPVELQQHTPASSSSIRKIRAKVGEKARMREEKSLFQGAFGEDEEQPAHLKNAAQTINPFLKMNSLPKFSPLPNQSSASGSINSIAPVTPHQTSKPAVSDPPSKTTTNTLNFSSSKQSFLDRSRELLTSSSLTADKADSPVRNNREEDRPLDSFVFSRPVGVSHSSESLDASCYSYAFSSSVKVRCVGGSSSRNSDLCPTSSPVTLTRRTSDYHASNNLPDLTRGGGNVTGNGKQDEDGARVFSVGAMTAVGKLQRGSVMDILAADNRKLPDVAASAGGKSPSSPVKRLAQGSVLDMLGKSSGSGTEAWSPNFSLPKKPWH